MCDWKGYEMRYFVGIAIGLMIIFNWTSIKSYFDKKIDEQAGQVTATQPEKPQSTAVQQKATTPQKQDLFKDFK